MCTNIYPVLILYAPIAFYCVFFFNDTATTEIYTLSLHDALPISSGSTRQGRLKPELRTSPHELRHGVQPSGCTDRKSTRLNSSHQIISYAVFCLKKKKITATRLQYTLDFNYFYEFHTPSHRLRVR